MTLDFAITRNILTVGNRDTVTGWRIITWIEDSTEFTGDPVEAYVESKGTAISYMPPGVYAREDAVAISYHYCELYDQIITQLGTRFQVIGKEEKTLANTSLYYVFQLRELPTWQASPTSATWKTAPSDPRSRTKIFLDAYLDTSAFTDNTDTEVNVVVVFADLPYPLYLEFRNTSTPVYGLILVGEPSNATPHIDLVDNTPYEYVEDVPITVCTMDSTNCSGMALKWKIEAELRKVLEEHGNQPPASTGTYRNLTKRGDRTVRMGEETLYMTEWMMQYIRDVVV